jgi:hypothetical protein
MLLSRVGAALALCATASATQSQGVRVAPITAPIRRAGVYHVATGTWTRNASLANVTGPDTIYNNTCSPSYFAPMQTGDLFQHRSRIPSTTGPLTGSPYFFDGCFWLRYDEAPGCQDSYTVDGFEFAYCSAATTTVDWSEEFASSYTSCAARDMVPQYSLSITGLPGGRSNGTQNCWIVDVDLSGNPGGGIVLSADGDGTYSPPSAQSTFGWSFGPTNGIALTSATGAIVAGAFSSCAGTDGTIWDNPINLAEPGTGMSSQNYFRMTGPNSSAPAGPGCYDLGGTRQADFWLKLFANAGCPACSPLTGFCFPGEGGIRACTACSPANPPSAHGRGCDNFGQHTGGAQLSFTGNSRVSADTIVLSSSFENTHAFTVLMQGTTTTNLAFGAGIRCIGGNLKRLYSGAAGGVPPCQQVAAFFRPGPDDPRSVHQASLDAGYDIAAHAPVTLYYQAFYRDTQAATYCGGATVNASQGGSLNWIP